MCAAAHAMAGPAATCYWCGRLAGGSGMEGVVNQ
uniref:Uncharacterized protein n=1 Tax=Arundo donax TaxID=35708 RepID=A0A0A8XMT8_ARUDO